MSAPTWDAILRKNGVAVHPAATLFPMMSADELEELARDIDANNLTSPLCLWRADDKAPWQLLDGRNRVAAMARLIDGEDRITGAIGLAAQYEARTDPWGFVVSANLHRRHLTVEKKREIAAALLKADPSKSDRRVASESGLNRTDVGVERKKLEQTGDVSIPDTRTDTKGRQQPATKPAKPPAPKPTTPSPEVRQIKEAIEKRIQDEVNKHLAAETPIASAADPDNDADLISALTGWLVKLARRPNAMRTFDEWYIAHRSHLLESAPIAAATGPTFDARIAVFGAEVVSAAGPTCPECGVTMRVVRPGRRGASLISHCPSSLCGLIIPYVSEPDPASETPIAATEPTATMPRTTITPERMEEIDREVNGRARASENRLFALWKNLKPNTQKRCVRWIEDDCPDPYPLLDDHGFREAAAPFRALAKQCTEAEIDAFVELTKATVH
jgi:hypothetical protein